MTRRSNQIYKYVKTKSAGFSLQDFKESPGLTAKDVADQLGLLRNNVSKELNELVKEQILIKIKTKPVYFFDKQSFENFFQRHIKTNVLSLGECQNLILAKEGLDNDPFLRIIGSNVSLKNQVERAKATIMYPPNGLNCLIIGETGVGKTLFAKVMYEYAKFTGRYTEKAPFITFNCADLYNNPQLLLSQLFGHLKGAFTGAENDKVGLIENADGGILFLDEIHRLTPEGQEMIFHFMDTGEYSRLGETSKKRMAHVMIIGATTEKPESVLLKTFLRRIPMVIDIPNFEERSTREKFELVKYLFSIEANRIGKSLKIDREVIEALIMSTKSGNIGQLKSNIQLVCAQGFLNSLETAKDIIKLTFDDLPMEIKNTFFSLQNRKSKLKDLEKYIIGSIIIKPDGQEVIVQEDEYELPYNLYKLIEEKVSLLKKEGVDDKFIEQFITTDINIHIKHNFSNWQHEDLNLIGIEKIVGEDMLAFVNSIKKHVEDRTGITVSDSFVYSLSLHICQLLKRVPDYTVSKQKHTSKIVDNNSEEYMLALEIKSLIEEKYNVTLPEMEVVYLKILINLIRETNTEKRVGVLVVTHGTAASSMVDVVNKLMGESQLSYIDIPLEEKPMDTYPRIVNRIKELDEGKGILLLVDMGSLAKVESIIQEEMNIKVKTIDMVSTPLILEAVRKTQFLKMDIDSTYSSLMKFKGYSPFFDNVDEGYIEKVIVTVCSTGDGAAVKLKELVQGTIYSMVHTHIRVIPIGIQKVEEKLKLLKEKYKIIATVGVTNVDSSIPFISLESLIQGKGSQLLKEILKSENYSIFESEESVIVEDLGVETLSKFLTFLNPHKIIESLVDFIKSVEDELQIEFKNSLKIMMLIHIGCALERIVLNKETKYSQDISTIPENCIKAIKKASKIFDDELGLKLCDGEIYTISEMIANVY